MSGQRYCFEIFNKGNKMKITKKLKKQEMSFLHAAHLLDMIHISTIYYQNIYQKNKKWEYDAYITPKTKERG